MFYVHPRTVRGVILFSLTSFLFYWSLVIKLVAVLRRMTRIITGIGEFLTTEIKNIFTYFKLWYFNIWGKWFKFVSKKFRSLYTIDLYTHVYNCLEGGVKSEVSFSLFFNFIIGNKRRRDRYFYSVIHILLSDNYQIF